MKAFLALAIWISTASIALGAETKAPEQPAVAQPMTISADAKPAASAVQEALPADQIQIVEKSIFLRLTDGTFIAELLLIFGALLAFLRGLAEALTRLSARFPGVSKPAKLVSDAAWILGAFIGKWGHGEPTLVSQEKAKAAQKEVTNGPADAGAPKAG